MGRMQGVAGEVVTSPGFRATIGSDGDWSTFEMSRFVRTERDHQILEALARKVRIMSLPQIAGAWWATLESPEQHARARLLDLYNAGFVGCLDLLSVPLIELSEPVATWSPGEPAPNPGAVSWRLVSRWPKLDPVRVTIFHATEATHNQYGGARTPRLPKADQVAHDLHVAQLYLAFLRERTEEAARWIGEDARRLSGFWLKDPDAVIDLGDARPPHVVEFGGRYDAERVEAFHRDCAKRDRSYELW